MSFVREIGKALMALRLSPLLKIRQQDCVLRFYPSNISLVLWVNSVRGRVNYPDDQNFLRSYLRSGDVVIDVGANVGLLSLVSGVAVGDAGKVYAFEAHPRIFKYLEGNIAANKLGNVFAHQLALGDKNGTVRFTDQHSDDKNRVIDGAGGIEVPLARLDDLNITDSSIALLKVDVEGYEKFVLEGAVETLSRVNCVYFESWDDWFADFGYTCLDIFDILTAHGFSIYKLQDKTLVPLSRGYHSPKCENLLAVRQLDDFLVRTGFNVDDHDE